MMYVRTIPCIFFLILVVAPAMSQLKRGQIDPRQVPLPNQHYQNEFTFDAPSDPALWKKEKKGLNVTFATTNELFLRSEVPALAPLLLWDDTGWQGERLNTQILV